MQGISDDGDHTLKVGFISQGIDLPPVDFVLLYKENFYIASFNYATHLIHVNVLKCICWTCVLHIY